MRKTIVLAAALVVAIGGIYFARLNFAAPEPEASPAVDLPPLSAAVPAGEVTLYEVVSGESEGRYLVREQLAGLSFPNDAVAVTAAVTGRVGIDPSGAVAEGSQIVVNLESLASDQGRRDQYVRTNILQTRQYPAAVFVPTEVRGLPQPLPEEGTANVVIVGELTIRNVTRQTVWEGTVTFSPDGFQVSVRTAFTFADFDLTKPRVALVLSVDDQIRLEADVKLRRE